MAMDETPCAGINRRRELRRRERRRGRLVFHDGGAGMDCLVIDLSASGARLNVADWRRLPDRFELQVENGPTRRAGVIGVRFAPEADN